MKGLKGLEVGGGKRELAVGDITEKGATVAGVGGGGDGR